MTEATENGVVSGAAESEESVKEEAALTEALENFLDISPDVKLTEFAVSEETDSGEKPAQEDGQQDGQRDRQQDRQSDGQRDRQQDIQSDGQQDGQTVSPPAAESSSAESKWVVGAQCQAVWTEDGQVYPATVVSLDGERCRVRFNGYGNQQDMELSALKSPEAVVQTQRQNSQEWKPGSRCRAVYSEDGLVYPAVVLWVKGQLCRVRFNDYNNEEEQDISSLLSPDELHGPSRASAAKGSSWKSSVTSSKVEWKRSRREERQQGERGGERRREENHVGDRGGGGEVKEKPSSKVEKEAEEKKRGNQQTDGAEKAANHSFCFFPPFPPPPQSGSGGPVSFIPPPPPLWTFAGRDSSSSAGVDTSSSMLMLWYMCGFHTGSYMAQQVFKSSSKD